MTANVQELLLVFDLFGSLYYRVKAQASPSGCCGRIDWPSSNADGTPEEHGDPETDSGCDDSASLRRHLSHCLFYLSKIPSPQFNMCQIIFDRSESVVPQPPSQNVPDPIPSLAAILQLIDARVSAEYLDTPPEGDLSTPWCLSVFHSDQEHLDLVERLTALKYFDMIIESNEMVGMVKELNTDKVDDTNLAGKDGGEGDCDKSETKLKNGHGVEVHTLRAEDVNSYCALLMAAYGFGVPLESLSAVYGAHISQDVGGGGGGGDDDDDVVYRIYAVTQDDVVVSAASMLVHKGTATVGVYEVATLPDFRGRGMATALLKKVMRVGQREFGCKRAILNASADGKRIYERLGYEVCPVASMNVFLKM